VVRTEVLRRRLQRLDEYLAILQRLGRYTLAEFISNPEHYGSAERFLQLAIESVNDMASHVVADLALGAVNAASDIPKIFHDRGYIDQEMAGKWARMNGFRNILVHDYLEIDRKLVHRVLQDDLADLKLLQGVFARFL